MAEVGVKAAYQLRGCGPGVLFLNDSDNISNRTGGWKTAFPRRRGAC